MADVGYIYCFSVTSVPGMVVMRWIQTPQLGSIGSSEAYTVEFTQRVSEPRQKYESLCGLLQQYEKKSDEQGFSYDSLGTIRECVSTVMGMKNTSFAPAKVNAVKGHSGRDMTKYFKDGETIRHYIRLGKYGPFDLWEGTYNLAENMIVHNGCGYFSLSAFAMEHYIRVGKTRKSAGGWKECLCKENEWISCSERSPSV